MALAALALIGGISHPAAAKRQPAKPSAAAAHQVSSIVIDAATGKVLSENNADTPNYPASLTKMMTLYLAFEGLESGKLHLTDTFVVSAHAAHQAPSKLNLRPNEGIALKDLILAVVTHSANDAAVTLGENIAGSEPAFAERMTAKARALGMKSTTFQNASGLPNPGQMTTPRDLAILARALWHDFPKEYAFFSTEYYTYKGTTYQTHNHLMQSFQGMDGIKTGFINASGFNLAASAVRNGRRLIGVVMGGSSAHGRDMQMAALLNDTFENLSDTRLAKAAPVAPAQSAPIFANATPAPAPQSQPQPQVLASAAPAPAASLDLAAAPSPVDTSATAPAPAPVVASNLPSPFTMAPISDENDAPKHPALARAGRAIAALNPVSRAEAATPPANKGAAWQHGRTAATSTAAHEWSIQVGAFGNQDSAAKAGAAALAKLGLKGKTAHVVPPGTADKDPLFRARIAGFSEAEAQKACRTLHSKMAKQQKLCAVIPPLPPVALRSPGATHDALLTGLPQTASARLND